MSGMNKRALFGLSTLALLAGLSACAGLPLAPASDQVEKVSAATSVKGPVILVSIDGFRGEYLHRGLTPTLSRLAGQGAWVRDGMRPSFPSITFPNHYTLVTGLRPDRHGIVHNTMQDPTIPDVTFTLGNKAAVADRRWWDEATPVWVTAERAGVPTATMFWPGSDTDVQGVRPSQWRLFDQKVPPRARVQQILDWLAVPEAQRPRFLTLYFDQVDTVGHRKGPNSPEIDAELKAIDAEIAALLEGLKAQGLDQAATLVIVADHGMTATAKDRSDFIDDRIAPEALDVVTTGPTLGLNPKPGFEAEVAAKVPGRQGHTTCWAKADIPAQYHYGQNKRVPAYLCLADIGWVITTRAKGNGYGDGGAHGYDPAHPDMKALFIATGPGIRPQALPEFDNTEVHDLLLCRLGLPPVSVTDGTGLLRARFS
ncbi:MAG: ectonucleotide pyrophosphatase/phosphodiesterase [Asticcacaulis sp.]